MIHTARQMKPRGRSAILAMLAFLPSAMAARHRLRFFVVLLAFAVLLLTFGSMPPGKKAVTDASSATSRKSMDRPSSW